MLRAGRVNQRSRTAGAASRMRSQPVSPMIRPFGSSASLMSCRTSSSCPAVGFRQVPAHHGTSRCSTASSWERSRIRSPAFSGLCRKVRSRCSRAAASAIDFSTLRPRGTRAKGAGSIASGPVSFMQVWDAMCGTILSTGARRGAMMATLRCDHPDIEEFVTAKQHSGQLRRFNLSVQVTDAFMAAVRRDDEWPLVFPSTAVDGDGETITREWPGEAQPVPCRVVRRIGARQLWERILRATYDYAEPGVLFIDRINRLNNLWYREHISATNPCGEIPLPPYGACDLGSLNLTRLRGVAIHAAGADRHRRARSDRQRGGAAARQCD